MAYTPPANNAVTFNFVLTPYTPPTFNLVTFNFGAVVGGVSRRRQLILG